MAEVYWIHLPEHTDMFSEGYIGITKNTAQVRLQSHIKDAKRTDRNLTILGNALNKYGVENLIVETLVICDIDYALDLEVKLRPKNKIGWNIVAGGSKPPIRVKGEATQATRDKISAVHKGKIVSQETRDKQSALRKGKPLANQEYRLARLREVQAAKRPWEFKWANMTIWSSADAIFQDYLTGMSQEDSQRKLGLSRGSLQKMFREFTKGWIPVEDSLWLSEFKKEADVGSLTT